MYFREGEPEIAETSQGFRWGMLALSALIILVGVFPSLVLNWFYF
jgi:NADH-quinone oxidoreductase subunit N